MPEDIACGREAETCSEAFLSAVLSKASNFKGDSGKDFRRRAIVTSSLLHFSALSRLTELGRPVVGHLAWKSAALEVRHRNRKIYSRVNKLTQNLHILKMAVEAEKEGFNPCFKQMCFFVLLRPRRKVRYVAECFFALQQYVHKCIGCGYAAVHGLDFEFSRTREGHLGSRPEKWTRLLLNIPLFGSMSKRLIRSERATGTVTRSVELKKRQKGGSQPTVTRSRCPFAFTLGTAQPLVPRATAIRVQQLGGGAKSNRPGWLPTPQIPEEPPAGML